MGLRRGTTAERYDARFLLCRGLSQNSRELFVFNPAEFRFAALGKNFGDALLRSFLDT